jgi:5-formyltetrahydrofolate cyclo-ligase
VTSSSKRWKTFYSLQFMSAVPTSGESAFGGNYINAETPPEDTPSNPQTLGETPATNITDERAFAGQYINHENTTSPQAHTTDAHSSAPLDTAPAPTSRADESTFAGNYVNNDPLAVVGPPPTDEQLFIQSVLEANAVKTTAESAYQYKYTSRMNPFQAPPSLGPPKTSAEKKRVLRFEYKQRRLALSTSDRARYSFAIAEQFAALPEFQGATFVHVYCSFGAEAETGVIIGRAFDAGKRVIVPITPVEKLYNRDEEAAKTLLHTEVDPDQPFGYDRYGMPAPLPMERDDPTAMLEYCVPAKMFSPLDCVVIPLVAFDDRCHRLGYGQGFYDRFLATLANTRCVKIGIAYSCQRAESLPIERHDEPVDILISESGTLRRVGDEVAFSAYEPMVFG